MTGLPGRGGSGAAAENRPGRAPTRRLPGQNTRSQEEPTRSPVEPGGGERLGRHAVPLHKRRDGGIESYRHLPAYGLLRHAAQRFPDREAIWYRGQSWNYQHLNHDAVRCAAMLQEMGVGPGDRVGILLPNVPEYVIAVNGIWRAGGIAVAISPLMVADEVQSLLRTTDCRIVIALDLLSGSLSSDEDCGPHQLIVSIRDRLTTVQQLGYVWMRRQRTGCWSRAVSEGREDFWQRIDACRREWQPVPIDTSSDPAYILPTGGTTAAPKAVTLSHQNLVANAWQQFEAVDRSFGKEKLLAVLPFFHSYGLSATVLGGAAMGASLVLHHRFQTRQVVSMIQHHRPTVFHAVPAMLVAINELLRRQPADLHSLRWVISGGAPLDVAVAAEFAEHTGARVVEGYGLSEASPVTHVGPLFEEGGYGTIGRPLPETECRIASAEAPLVETEHDGVGELLIKGPQVMLGYWKNPDSTREVIRDGWLHTGDLARRDAEGLYRIVGRQKDLVITSGFNVYPAEVEEVLAKAEGVAEAAVIGEPDSRAGELVKAVVVMKPDSPWDEDALRSHCAALLAKHKVPRLFEQRDEPLPRNFLGKVIRRHLRPTAS